MAEPQDCKTFELSMRGARIYLDYNATAPARPAAVAAALAAIEVGGNASSIHEEGRKARHALEMARSQVARLCGSRSDQVIFTSGGTEAANLALEPACRAGQEPFRRLLLGATEHAAVLAGHRFAADAVDLVPVDGNGVVDLERLRNIVRQGGPAVLALQAANNETGVIQPVREAAEMVQRQGGVVVCDAVQAAGRISCAADALGADIVLLSAHKLGGLPGAGAAVVLGDAVRLTPLIRGGGQERGMRGGTENRPAIAAFGAAAEMAQADPDGERLAGLRDKFEAGLREIAPDAVIFGEDVPRLPNTCAFAVPGMLAERLILALDLGGVAVSSGSACSSGKVGRSHVLEAMAIGPDLRGGAIRVSFGWRSAEADADAGVAVLGAALDRMRRRIRAAA